VVRTRVRGSDAEAVGRAAAERLLERDGGRSLLVGEGLDEASAL